MTVDKLHNKVFVAVFIIDLYSVYYSTDCVDKSMVFILQRQVYWYLLIIVIRDDLQVFIVLILSTIGVFFFCSEKIIYDFLSFNSE